MLDSLVRKHIPEGRPAGIKNGLRHAGLCQSRGIDVAHGNVIKLANETGRKLEVKVVSAMRQSRVDRFDAPLLVGALRYRQCLLRMPVDVLRPGLLAGRQRGKIFQAKVNADPALGLSYMRRIGRNINHDVEESAAARVSGKIGTVLDLPLGQGAAIEYPERVSGQAEGIALALEFTPLDRHPGKRLLGPIAEIRPLLLGSRPGVLPAHCIDGAGMQREFPAAAGGELVQIEPSEPLSAKAQCVLLPVVAVIPDEVARSGLLVQQAVERLHPVAIDKDHCCFFKSPSIARRISWETGMSNFSASAWSLANLSSGRDVVMRFIYRRYQPFSEKAATTLQSAPFTPRPEGRVFSEQN